MSSITDENMLKESKITDKTSENNVSNVTDKYKVKDG